jgi:uncharacterized protein YndB with AHSA1/START domain
MKWVVLVLAAVAGLAVVVTAIGAAIPRDHVAATSATVRAAPQDVWHAITDVAAFPQWRAVAEVVVLDSASDRTRWREVSKSGGLTFEQTEVQPPQRLVTRIVDADAGFGGSWTYELSPTNDGGTRVLITERGFVTNLLFRFMTHFIFGYHGTQEAFLRALGRKFGQDLTPVRS